MGGALARVAVGQIVEASPVWGGRWKNCGRGRSFVRAWPAEITRQGSPWWSPRLQPVRPGGCDRSCRSWRPWSCWPRPCPQSLHRIRSSRSPGWWRIWSRGSRCCSRWWRTGRWRSAAPWCGPWRWCQSCWTGRGPLRSWSERGCLSLRSPGHSRRPGSWSRRSRGGRWCCHSDRHGSIAGSWPRFPGLFQHSGWGWCRRDWYAEWPWVVPSFCSGQQGARGCMA